MVYTAYQEGMEYVFVAPENAPQAALITGIEIIPVETLGQLVEHLYGLNTIVPYIPPPLTISDDVLPEGIVDFADIKGQGFIAPTSKKLAGKVMLPWARLIVTILSSIG